MVVSYWDMAAALVNNGAIGVELFQECNAEHIGVFAKIEPLLKDIRAAYSPRFAAKLEKLIDTIPDGRKLTAEHRERMKAIVAQMTAQHSTASHKG
jgi:hypothetical protein